MILRRVLIGLAAACLVFGIATAALALHEEAGEDGLIAKLQHGGYVVYMRHAQRYKGPPDQLHPDSPPSAFADCSRQRNLTPYGIDEAALLGEDLRRAGIGIGIVIAHPECRARDTAMLTFGRAKLDVGMFDPEFIRQQLAVTPLPGSDNFLVGGENPLRQIIGFQIDAGEMAIFQPDGQGGTRLIGLLKPEDWFDD
ncbi:MAG TPA: hypothetical protein VGF43_16480 [Dongiaceae bacterium]